MPIPVQYENINKMFVTNSEYSTRYNCLEVVLPFYFSTTPIQASADLKNISYVSDDFTIPHSNLGNNTVIYLETSTLITIRLTTNQDTTVSATYENINAYELFDYLGGSQYAFRLVYTDSFVYYISYHSYEYLNEYKQSLFNNIDEAINYIYTHYANIILYVDGEKWVDPTPVQYNWQSVPSISGKNGILTLSTLNDVNDGEPVETSDTSKFNLTDDSNVSALVAAHFSQ